MTDVITSNVTLNPNDGWVLISPTSVGSFLRISHIPAHVPIYLTVADSLPTTPGIGFRVDCDSVHFDGGFTGNLYARISANATAQVIISVWQNPNSDGGGGGGSTTAVASATAPTYGPGAQPLSQDLSGNLRVTGTINAVSAATATTAAPSYTNNTSNPFSQDLSGHLRVTLAGAANTVVVSSGTFAVQNTTPLVAGSAIIGQVSINQTTPGTTNAVFATNLPTTVTTNIGVPDASTIRVVNAQSSSPTLTQVSGSASSVTLLSANTARMGATIVNTSSAILYVAFGPTASTSAYTVQLAAAGAVGTYYEVPFNYRGQITGIWASATGNAVITEIT